MYIYIYQYVYIYIYICMCVYIYIYTYIYIHPRPCLWHIWRVVLTAGAGIPVHNTFTAVPAFLLDLHTPALILPEFWLHLSEDVTDSGKN